MILQALQPIDRIRRLRLQILRQLRIPFTHQDQRHIDRLASVLDQFERTGRDGTVPTEVLGHEAQNLALVGGVEVVELIAFGFENGDPG